MRDETYGTQRVFVADLLDEQPQLLRWAVDADAVEELRDVAWRDGRELVGYSVEVGRSLDLPHRLVVFAVQAVAKPVPWGWWLRLVRHSRQWVARRLRKLAVRVDAQRPRPREVSA